MNARSNVDSFAHAEQWPELDRNVINLSSFLGDSHDTNIIKIELIQY